MQELNTIDDALELIKTSKQILILTGAGISEFFIFCNTSCAENFTGVSCGIPDFRSRDGLYASLKDRGDYELDDPQQMSFSLSLYRDAELTAISGSTYSTSVRNLQVRLLLKMLRMRLNVLS